LVRFETAPAWETPAAMAELHESLARARGGEHHPLLVIGCYVFDLEHETTQYNPPALEFVKEARATEGPARPVERADTICLGIDLLGIEGGDTTSDDAPDACEPTGPDGQPGSDR